VETRSRLVIDADRPDRILLDGEPVELRPAEFRLLRVLAEAPRACVEYEDIYHGIWGDETFVEPAQIYSHRSRLASKLADAAPDGADLLRTIPKRGIMLDLPAERVSVSS
jgi:DNA-binding response OmpR family regulator